MGETSGRAGHNLTGRGFAPGLPCVVAALVALLAVPGVAAADNLAPTISPDRIEDAPSTRADPYPTFDAFAWRAFIALNWPAAVEGGRRAEPDRARTLGDPGPRVWETFKERHDSSPSVSTVSRPRRRRGRVGTDAIRAARASTIA